MSLTSRESAFTKKVFVKSHRNHIIVCGVGTKESILCAIVVAISHEIDPIKIFAELFTPENSLFNKLFYQKSFPLCSTSYQVLLSQLSKFQCTICNTCACALRSLCKPLINTGTSMQYALQSWSTSVFSMQYALSIGNYIQHAKKIHSLWPGALE